MDASADAAVVAVATAAGATILRREEGSAYAVVGNVAPEGGARASAVGVASDGNAVAIGCENGEVRVLRACEVTGDATDAGATALRRHRGEVTAARFHPSDPSTLATCDANREVLVWNVDTGAVVMDKMVFHTARVTSLAWCPDGRRIATGGLDGAVIVWDLDKPAVARATAEGAHPGGSPPWIGWTRRRCARRDSTRACGRGEREEETRRIFRVSARRDRDPRDTNGARRMRISDKTPPRRHLASVRAVVGFAARCATRRVRRISSGSSAERDEDAGRAAVRARRVGASPGGKRHVSRSPRGK